MSDRKPLISGNWKMHHTHLDAIAVVQKLSYALRDEDYDAVDVSVHPTFVSLRSVQTVILADKLKLALGAQNCYWEDHGAFTGEVSPSMLAKLEVSYVIVGHSERRELFGETDETVNKKAKAVFAAGMTPIMCVGETLDEREAGGAEGKVDGQVRAGLAGLSAEQIAAMVIAYEPIWAIGTGRTATADDAQAMCALIRTTVGDIADEASSSIRIQYGGSVKPANTAELMAQPDIDGALVGGASLDADDFARIVRSRIVTE
ncbi:MAG TPA: triose-phosphate isomerase [Acidimicrobiales bacterium]|nr:triose-phosphate isomerase [Acidimicrobiales bacterium]